MLLPTNRFPSALQLAAPPLFSADTQNNFSNTFKCSDDSPFRSIAPFDVDYG